MESLFHSIIYQVFKKHLIMKNLKFSALLLFLSSIFALPSCTEDAMLTEDGLTNPGIENRSSSTIVEIALSDPDFSILVDAVVRANLVGALSSRGPFTVFAPTNDAFDAFLSANGFTNINEVPVGLLTTVLTTHVLRGEAFAADINSGYFKTLATAPNRRPSDIYISADNGVTINGDVNVVAADVDASNGVIHVIDKVIAPSSIVTLAASNPNFSILVQALTRPDLSVDFVAALSGNGPFTVLAPTNAAFVALLDSNPAWSSLDDIPAATLEAVLTYHVAAGSFTSEYLFRRPTINTLLDGATYTTSFSFGGGGSTFGGAPTLNIIAGSNQAKVVASNVQAQNGVIHAIDAVILP